MPLCLEGGLNYISLYCVRKVPSLIGPVCHKVHFSCVERGPPSQKSALSDFKKVLPINDVKTFHLILFKVNVKF